MMKRKPKKGSLEYSIGKFLEYQESEVRSQATYNAYKWDLTQFARKVGPEKLLKSVSYEDYLKYRSAITRDGLSVKSKNRKLSSLKKFFSECKKLKWIKENPVEDEKPTRNGDDEDEPVIFTADELNRILEAEEDPRFLAMYKVMARAGLRISEVIKLKIEHVDLKTRTIKVVRGKGRKNRDLPGIDQETMDAIKKQIGSRESGHVFLTNSRRKKGQPFKRTYSIQKRFKELIDQLGIQGSCHALRRTFGSMVYEETKDIVLVARLMGHKSIETSKKAYVNIENGLKVLDLSFLNK